MVLLAFAESIQLVPDGTLVIHIAIIITMVFLLKRTLFKPINRTLDERESQTRGRSKEARGIIERVESNLTRYEDSLRQARAEGYRLLEQQQAEASAERQRKIASVRKDVEEVIGQERGKIQAQADEAREVLEDEARRVAASISAQILRR
jgi:F-type H+-transporting ATPase subunit b